MTTKPSRAVVRITTTFEVLIPADIDPSEVEEAAMDAIQKLTDAKLAGFARDCEVEVEEVYQ